MRKSFLIALLFSLYLASVLARIHHECTHDKKFGNQKKPQRQKLSTFEKRFRHFQPKRVAPIRIVLDYSNMARTLTSQERTFIESIMRLSVDFLAKRIRVETTGLPLRLPATRATCQEAKVPIQHSTTGVDGDLLIYVTAAFEPAESYFAWATFCHQDPATGRPVAGQVNWNTKSFNYDPKEFQAFVDVAIHELMHVLVFHSQLYSDYVDAFGSTRIRPAGTVDRTVTIRGRSAHAIVTPKVMSVAREYFGCQNIAGVDLEDQGGSGSASSHWERATLHNEIMGASNLPDEAFSAFSLALLEDSGWYQVDYTLAEPLYFGRGAGCQYFQGSCTPQGLPNRPEWCSSGQEGCTLSRKEKGYCAVDSYANGCSFLRAYSNGNCEQPFTGQNVRGEVYAPGSRCVMGNVISRNYVSSAGDNGLCYSVSCTASGINFRLNDGVTITCTRPGTRVNAPSPYTGSIICPDPALFCQPAYLACRNDCSRNGYCNSGRCECIVGWTGDDCSVRGTGIGGSTTGSSSIGYTSPTGSSTTGYTGIGGTSGSSIGGTTGVRPGSTTTTTTTTTTSQIAGGYSLCGPFLCLPNSVCRSGDCVCAPGFTGARCNRRQ